MSDLLGSFLPRCLLQPRYQPSSKDESCLDVCETTAPLRASHPPSLRVYASLRTRGGLSTPHDNPLQHKHDQFTALLPGCWHGQRAASAPLSPCEPSPSCTRYDCPLCMLLLRSGCVDGTPQTTLVMGAYPHMTHHRPHWSWGHMKMGLCASGTFARPPLSPPTRFDSPHARNPLRQNTLC
jgi:hypothetical protein